MSYGDLAEANGVEWNKAYRLMGGHLGDLVRWSHAQGLPMISAIVVNKEHLETGRMNEETLRGFAAAAEDLGIPFQDPAELLKQQQEAIFERFAPRA